MHPDSAPARPRVAVLLAVHNGERFLQAQLDSIDAQTGVSTTIVAGDDSSTDQSAAIVQSHFARRGAGDRLHALGHRNANRTFLDLLARAVREEPSADWFAYCDQDDIWLPDKLERGIGALAHVDGGTPALYGARTIVVDQDDQAFGMSRLFKRPASFRNAIVQNIMAGNTMVFNRRAAQLLVTAGSPDIAVHDWWTYMLVCGAGGHVIFDPRPCLRYRQHGGNQIGSHLGLQAALARLARLWRGDFRQWNRLNLAALQAHRDLLCADARATLDCYLRATHAASAWGRLREFRRSGVYRQSTPEQLLLATACALGKL